MTMIAQVVQHMSPGGIETMALDLADFCQENEKTIIISLEGDLESATKQWPRLKPYQDRLIFLNKQPGNKPSLIFKLRNLFKQLNIDVVHTHHIGPLLYAGMAARLAGIRHLIHTEHDAWHLNNKKRRSLQRLVIFMTRPKLVADAATVAKAMKKHLKTKQINTVYNGIDTYRFKPGDQMQARIHLNLPRDVKIIGCSGRLEEVKGQKTLIYALIRLKSSVHLALAGTGSYEPSLRKLVDSLGLNERVHFLGRIDDMPMFYNALDVFCLPSLNEGFPLSPLEAQSCGIQTVVTDVGGSRETLCPHSGLLVPKENVDMMTTVLSKALRRPYHASPRKYVQEHADVRLMTRKYTDLRQAGEMV